MRSVLVIVKRVSSLVGPKEAREPVRMGKSAVPFKTAELVKLTNGKEAEIIE